MTRQQLLAAAAAAYRRWSLAHADGVATRQADRNPHDGRRSDYNEHHATRSAPPAVDDLLNAELARLVRQRTTQPWQRRAADQIGRT